jgi:SAM-dependent methyltransferase
MSSTYDWKILNNDHSAERFRAEFNAWAINKRLSYDQARIDREYKAPYILAEISKPLIFGIVLDVGCGTGAMAQQILPHKSINNIDGIDVSKNMLEICAQQGKYRNLYLANARDNRTIQNQDQRYDSLISCGTYGDCIPGKELQEMLKLLAKRSVVCISGQSMNVFNRKMVYTRVDLTAVLKQNGFNITHCKNHEGFKLPIQKKNQSISVEYTTVVATRN